MSADIVPFNTQHDIFLSKKNVCLVKKRRFKQKKRRRDIAAAEI
jgi:hypothetical protein